VKLAYGRDCGDVPPLRGVIRGGGTHTLAVAVTVAPMDQVLAPAGHSQRQTQSSQSQTR
jgi:transglutaminase-like putative cysteine protease